MVGKSPKDRVVGPLPNGRTFWLINGDDPNHLRDLSWEPILPPNRKGVASVLVMPCHLSYDINPSLHVVVLQSYTGRSMVFLVNVRVCERRGGIFSLEVGWQ